jgi:hypothetical protein
VKSTIVPALDFLANASLGSTLSAPEEVLHADLICVGEVGYRGPNRVRDRVRSARSPGS